ncbi:hypothetical protein QG516_03480 [Pedobacter gandavensis]|uniref:hypothetical protein n=1 Tax=Pedobacter gandavensis TaxID=2679963 RepID=UPI00247A0D96|nr:hypothetical protein [Pedobacter gandavensis]WGQ10716.1 hypothetical protein QG516_03480 [Pedobacter gandavensis]
MAENQEIRSVLVMLGYEPNRHIVVQAMDKYEGIPNYTGFSFGFNLEGSRTRFLETSENVVYKINFTCDLEFYDHTHKTMDFQIPNFSLELYQTDKDGNEMTLMNVDELVYYVSTVRNDEVKIRYNFPPLTACEYSDIGDNANSKGREIRNKYFPTLAANSLNLYFEDELKEGYAVATNALAFLYKHKDRVIGELKVLNNDNYRSDFHMFPRFNNAIAEVAGSIYSIWERTTFMINEFFPADPKAAQAPSFIQFMKAARKKVLRRPELNTAAYQWLLARFDNEHTTLSELRHPTVHFNDKRTPNGMRSTELLKIRPKDLNVYQLEKKWLSELDFLKTELGKISEGLLKAVQLIEEWAVIEKNALPSV